MSTIVPRPASAPPAAGITDRAAPSAAALATVIALGLGGPAAASPSAELDAAPATFRLNLADDVLLGALAQPASDAMDDAATAPPTDGEAIPADAPPVQLLGGDDAGDSLARVDVAPRYGEAGSVRLDLRAGYGTDVQDGDQWIAQGGIGLSGFIEDGLALRVELNGAQIRQVEGSEQGVNVALLFEWHFLRRESWSLFLDAGAGVLFTTDDVPAGGSSFNFTPQAGLGLTAALSEDLRLVAGVKWHHISNANTFDENPGRDHVMVYTGLSLPF